MDRGDSQGWITRAVGGLLDRSLVDKCIWISALTTLGVVWHAVITYYLFRNPDVAPYIDQSVIHHFFPPIISGLLLFWVAMVGIGLSLRRRSPDNHALVYVTTQSLAVTITGASYLSGTYTNLFTGTLCLGAIAIGFILFDKRAMIPAVACALGIIVLTTVAEQLGLIPYAPMLAAAPFEHARLSRWWLVGFGGVSSGFFIIFISILFVMIERWRDREAELAVISEQLTRANEVVSRYVASQLAEQIRAGNDDMVKKFHRRRLTMFFSDIKDFAEIAEDVEPAALNRLLGEYLSEMTQIAERFGGTIDKFVGDAIMIFFGAPMPADDRENAIRAVRMAIEMQARVQELNTRWRASGLERPLEVRIGINTGHASIGNFGSKSRMDYTAIGKQVNLAARLQADCEPGRILISHSTQALIQDGITCEPRGEIQVKGLRDPVKIYEVTEKPHSFAHTASGR